MTGNPDLPHHALEQQRGALKWVRPRLTSNTGPQA
jgi:hypothetical protein